MEDYKGYTIRQASKSGGKAGKGLNKTSTIQVLKQMGMRYLMKKQIVFTVNNKASLELAHRKARNWIDEQTNTEAP